MSSPHDTSVGIGLGNQADAAITRGNDLVFVQEYAPGLKCRVNVGRATLQNINNVIECLERLRVHAVDPK